MVSVCLPSDALLQHLPSYLGFMVDRSDRMRSTGEGNGKPLQYSCLENTMNSMKRQNDTILKEELPRLVGAQYATGGQWRNNSKKNEKKEEEEEEEDDILRDHWGNIKGTNIHIIWVPEV